MQLLKEILFYFHFIQYQNNKPTTTIGHKRTYIKYMDIFHYQLAAIIINNNNNKSLAFTAYSGKGQQRQRNQRHHGNKCGRIWNVYRTIRKWTRPARWHLHCRKLILAAAMASAWTWMAYIRIGRRRWRTPCCIRMHMRNKSTINLMWYARRNYNHFFFLQFAWFLVFTQFYHLKMYWLGHWHLLIDWLSISIAIWYILVDSFIHEEWYLHIFE